jgi:C-terminal processing protease CtpA/Prc
MKRPLKRLCILASLFLACASTGQNLHSQNEYQQLVDAAWKALNEQYSDSTFNGLDWPQVRQELLARVYHNRQEAYAAIHTMLAQLNDSATRFLTEEQAAAMLAEFFGQAREGTGLIELLCVEGIVLDLRNNPGGFVPACQEVAGIFLGEKPIAKILGRGNNFSGLPSQGEKLTDKPVVVLVNEGTASAAELVAGALQDERRASIVGTRTFGKGLVHNLAQLPDSSALMITTGRLRTLKGRDIL